MSVREDLAAQLGPPPGEDIIIAQGVIHKWDPATFENEVVVDGVTRRNMRVGSGAEALTYAPGDVVLVWKWFPGGAKGELGAGTSWIAGRVLTPGTDAATRAVGFMQTTLATEISAEVFAARITNDLVETLEQTQSIAFGDLTTVGPQVTVEVTAAAKMEVEVGCFMNVQSNGGWMSFEVRDASNNVVVAPDTRRAFHTFIGSGTHTIEASRRVVLDSDDGLSAGTYAVTAKYMAALGPPSPSAGFRDRTISVTAF